MVARRSASCRLSVGRASERRWVTRISSLLGSLDALPEKSYPVLADDDVIYKPSFLSWLIAAQSVDHAASFSYYVYRTGGLSVGQGCDGFSFWKPNLACITDLARAHVAETAYRLHDELSISYCLATKGVRVKMIPPPDGSLIYEKNIDASSLQHLSGAQWRERLQRQGLRHLLRTGTMPFATRWRLYALTVAAQATNLRMWAFRKAQRAAFRLLGNMA